MRRRKYTDRDGCTDEDRYADKDQYGDTDGYGDEDGYGDADGYVAQDGYSDADGYGAQDGYSDADGYGAQDGYGDADGYGAQDGYSDADGYGAQDGYSDADGYGARDGYGDTDGYRTQDGYGDADGYVAQDGYGDTDGYRTQDGYGDAGGYVAKDGYSDADGYGAQDGYGDADGYVAKDGYGDMVGYRTQDGYSDADGCTARGGYGDTDGYGDEHGYTDRDDYGDISGYEDGNGNVGVSVHAGGKRRSHAMIMALAVVLLIFAALALILFALWRIMAAKGEESLRADTINTVPAMVMDEPLQENDGQVWKEGWVRYNGKVYEYNENILTFLFLGIDKFETVSPNPDRISGGQADAIFLAVADPDTKKISLIGINRDTMVDIRMAGYTNNGSELVYTAQLAVQHGFGDGMEESCELTRDAVSELFYNLPIHGYVSFNMGGVAALNDALGGVELPALGGMTGFNSEWTEGAWLTLTGTDAFEYVHYRDPDEFESSRLRLERQKQYLNAFVQKAVDAVKKDITLPVALYNSLKDYIVTDISIDEITYLAGELIGYQFDGNDVYTLEGTTEKGEFEEFYPDKQELRELILQIFYREIE